MTVITGTGSLFLLVSMFAPPGTGGVRGFRLDAATGTLAADGGPWPAANPFFLAVTPDGRTVYGNAAARFGSPDDEEVIAWRLDAAAGTLTEINRQSTRGNASCYVELDDSGRALLIANYSNGSVATLPVAADGSLSPAASFIRHEPPPGRTQAKAHAIVPVAAPDGCPFVYAADLGLDRILCYRLDPATATLVPGDPPFVDAPDGAGPRHLAVAPSGRHLYAVNELANSVTVYDRDTASGRLRRGPTVSTLPDGFAGKSFCADVKLRPDGRFLYATNRGHDSIAVFRVGDDGRLERLAIVPSRGGGPQNLALSPDGRLLVCANMTGDNLAVFAIPAETGVPAPLGDPVPCKAPSCIRVVAP
jgi:6-phosphogluconolactonase